MFPSDLRSRRPVALVRSAGVTGPIVAAPSAALLASLKVAVSLAASRWFEKPPSQPESSKASLPASIREASVETSISCVALELALSGPPAKKFWQRSDGPGSLELGKPPGAPYSTT